MKCAFIPGLVSTVFFVACAAQAQQQTIVTVGPATQPAAVADKPTTKPAEISADVRPLLNDISKAYSALKAIKIEGTITGNFDIDGQKHTEHGDFTGEHLGNKFRSTMKGDTEVGSNGSVVYAYLTDSNRYHTDDAPDDAVTLDSIEDNIADVVRAQDYSLALAMTKTVIDELSHDAQKIDKGDDMTIDGMKFPVVKITESDRDDLLAFDPKTYLLRRKVVDVTRGAKAMGAGVVKEANYTVDFTNTTSDSLDDKTFAWAPPAGAQELEEKSPLDGSPAPTFELADLSGQKINTKSLKGKVYVIDFWATWCAPCVAELPELDDMQKEYGTKVTFLAVNLQDEKAAVQKFASDKKISLKILLDTDGHVGNAYGADKIPETVVVGKDGIVAKAFIGASGLKALKRQIDNAVAAADK